MWLCSNITLFAKQTEDRISSTGYSLPTSALYLHSDQYPPVLLPKIKIVQVEIPLELHFPNKIKFCSGTKKIITSLLFGIWKRPLKYQTMDGIFFLFACPLPSFLPSPLPCPLQFLSHISKYFLKPKCMLGAKNTMVNKT